MNKTMFDVPKMDCPSEERVIRLALDGASVSRLEFDLSARSLVVWHEEPAPAIAARLEPLGYGARTRLRNLRKTMSKLRQTTA